MSLASEVDNLFAVVTATGVRQVHLVGGSYGAIVALHAARDPRARWRTVSLFEPPLFATGAGLEPVLARYRAAVQAGRLAAAARLFAADVARVPTELLSPASESDNPDADVASHADGGAVATAAGCGADLEALVADDTDLAHWDDITAPILLLQGELTWQPMPSTMAILRQVLPPSTEHVVLAGQSHFAPHTLPASFAAALLAFLERHTEST